MELAIQRLNGALYNLSDYNLTALDFQVDAPSPRIESEVIEGMDGVLETEVTYDVRTLRASFYFKSVDNIDFALLRNEIFRMFASKEPFYLIDSREPGKRWQVRANGFQVEQLKATRGRFDVDFIAPHPYAESIGTSLDPMTFDEELWQVGQGLTEEGLEYSFNEATFRVFNPGDKTIDPRKKNTPLAIEFTGASTNLTIENSTTGDVWTYTGATEAGDVLRLDSVKALKNNVSIFKDTNRKLITLKEGWNDFIITGTTGEFTLDFDFRFYYL